MKKSIISLMLSVITFFGCVAFPACDVSIDGNGGTIQGELTQLSAPTNVRVENGIIRWSSVSNADSYVVQAGAESNQATTTELQYPLSALLSKSTSNVYVKVKALPSSSILYSESEWSALYGPFDYVVEVDPMPGGASVDWDDVKVSNGLGSTINAIEDEFIVPTGTASIFNTEKLHQLSLTKSMLNKQEISTTDGESVSKIADNWKAKLGVKYSNEINFYGFMESLDLNVDISVDIDYSKEYEEYYYILSQTIIVEQLVVDGYTTYSKFYNALSDDFLTMVKNVKDDAGAAALIRAYGTHFIAGGLYGGRIDVSYNMVSTDSEYASSVRAGVDVDFKSGVKDLGSTSTGVAADIENTYKKNTEDTKTSLTVNAIGGVGGFSGFNDLNNGYTDWIASVKAQEYPTLIDVPRGGLICIWDILPVEEYALQRNILDSYLQARTNEEYEEFLQEHQLRDNNHLGGENNPYEISSETDFLDFLSDETMNAAGAYAVLKGDLNFSTYTNWALKANVLYANFDGNNHTIAGFNSMDNGKEMSGEYRHGLFALIEGELSNLIIDNATVVASNIEKEVYAGMIAGINNGIIRDCKVINSSIEGKTEKSVGTGDRLKISVGGIVGKNNGLIEGCEVKGTTVYGYSNIGASDGHVEANCGGIAGINDSEITECNVLESNITSTVRGGKTWTFTRFSTHAHAGGICGHNSGQISICIESGNVFSVSYIIAEGSYPNNYNKQGAIVGLNEGVIFNNSYDSLENEAG